MTCTTIEAVMYGMRLSAKIAMRSTAPPANMLNMPRMPLGAALKACGEGGRVDAGHRDVGAEPINEQRAQREPDALLQGLRPSRRSRSSDFWPAVRLRTPYSAP